MAHLFKRGNIYWIKYYVSGTQHARSLGTSSLQIAKELKRTFESAHAHGDAHPLPTRTPIAEVLQRYVDHIRAFKTPKAAQTDIYYLREAFGDDCDALKITSRNPSPRARKRPRRDCLDRTCKPKPIRAACFEAITTSQIAAFIEHKVRVQGLKPKTANHYRSIIRRVFNWAMQHDIIRLPNQVNPASKVRPWKEQAPEIRFLTLPRIDEQLAALAYKPQLRAMVATLIYAGLRREELVWLTLDDIDFSRRHGGHGVIRVRAKTIGGRSWQPKTKRNRAVPISSALRAILDNYSPRATTHPALNENFRGWFFPSPDGKWWDPDNFSHDLRAANAEAGLRWSSLDYRHAFGSHLAQNGVSLYKISTLMGNSPEICRRHYAALVPETMAAEVEFAAATSNLHRLATTSRLT